MRQYRKIGAGPQLNSFLSGHLMVLISRLEIGDITDWMGNQRDKYTLPHQTAQA